MLRKGDLVVRAQVAAILTLIVIGLLAAGCGGASDKSATAREKFCAAQANLDQRIEQTSSLAISNITADGLIQTTDGIKQDLSAIEDSDVVLDATRRQGLVASIQQFEANLQANGGQNADPAQTLTTLIGAVTTLRTDVQQSMTGVDCP